MHIISFEFNKAMRPITVNFRLSIIIVSDRMMSILSRIDTKPKVVAPITT